MLGWLNGRTLPAIGLCSLMVLIAGCGGSHEGIAAPPPVLTKLCPDALDFSTTYTGGAGSGEYVKVKFDTTARTYQMQFVLSSIPTSAGQLNATREGMTINGTFRQATALPTAEQNRCAFVLENGVSTDTTYSVTVNSADPPMLFAGFGVVTGSIPGASIEFGGVALLGNLGAMPARSFDSFPYIGFTETETDFTKVAGNYNALGLHLSPTGTSYQTAAPQGWQPDVVHWNQTLNSDGTCTITAGSDYSCRTTGSPWSLYMPGGVADQVFISRPTSAGVPYPSAGQGQPIVLLNPSQAKAIMIVGQLRGALIPIVVRVGQAHIPPDIADLLDTVIDAEFGMSVLAPSTALAANSIQGNFIGPTSASLCGIVTSAGNSGAPAVGDASFDASIPHPDLPGIYSGTLFQPTAGSCLDNTAVSTPAANYAATRLQGATLGFVDPQTSTSTGLFAIDYTQAVAGLIGMTAQQDFKASGAGGPVAIVQNGDTGWMIKVGDVYAMVMNNSKFNPFFAVGTLAQ